MRPISSALALVTGLSLAGPVLAQDQTGPDADQDQFVTREEASAYDEQRFGEVTGGTGEMTREQFTSLMATVENPDQIWQELDPDGDNITSQQEWTEWRREQFDELAAGEDQVGLEDYQSIELGSMIGTGATGTTGGAPGTTGGGLDAMEGAIEMPEGATDANGASGAQN